MCYYSKSMRAGTFREATPEDNIVMGSDINGHHFAVSADDHKVLCIRTATDVHIARLNIRTEHRRSFERQYPILSDLIDQPVMARFIEMAGSYSNDFLVIDGMRVPFAYFEDGMEFYIGPKRPSLEQKLGTDDPSIALDHKVEIERELVTTR